MEMEAMGWKKRLAVLSVALAMAGFSLIGLSYSHAQQMPPNPPTQKERQAAASPSPSVSPSPQTSPTPEVIIEDDEPISVETELVNVLFTAIDGNRRFVTNLKQEDIRILEDGQEQEIFTFLKQIDLPLSIAVLIDTSQSQQRTLPEEREAAKSFIENVVRPNKDEVAVLSFTGETTLEQDLTGNIARLRRAVDRVEFIPASGTSNGVLVGTPPISGRNQAKAASTAIWDAIWITSDEVLGNAPERTRRAIILLTDGLDTYSSKKMDEAVSEAIRNEVIIYCIGIGDYYYGGVDEGTLKRLAEKTGGRAYFPREEIELRRAFDQIQIEMRSQFLVAYSPSNPKKDGTYRNIKVEVKNPELQKQKIKLTHRQGYFAKTEQPAAKPKK